MYTYDNGEVHHLPVEVGIYDSVRAEILSGIDKEDLIITTWSSELLEGAKVQLAGENAKEAETEEHDNVQTESTQAE